MPNKTLVLLAVFAASCSSANNASTATVAPTLPADFSVPQIAFTTEPATSPSANAVIDCVGLTGSFADLVADPTQARESLSGALDQLVEVATDDLDADIAVLQTALATVTDQASAVAKLGEPITAAALQRVQAFVQSECL